MSEYAIGRCVDKDGGRSLARHTAVLIRRVQPPLPTVYTIICDSGGRPRPWQATRMGNALMQTGPVHLATDNVYLAAWLPRDQLNRQTAVVSGLADMGRGEQYEFQPSADDHRRGRVRATRWTGASEGGGGLPPGDAALLAVMNDLHMNDLMPIVVTRPPAVKREFARMLFEELEEAKFIEMGAPITFFHIQNGQHHIRDRLMENHAYASADPRTRANMIAEWQSRLLPAMR